MKRWRQYRPDPDLSKKLSSRLNISPITAQVLINRGITDQKLAADFLDPKLASLSDPRRMPGMEKACSRVLKAAGAGERVAVYGDYDVDGVTGTAILLETLKFLNIDCGYYIPHRYREGYGMNSGAVRRLKEDGYGLIVTVDCGVGNVGEIKLAGELGMDVIVTDHHNPPGVLPPALSIVNPKLAGPGNSCFDLSGAGVAFKFAWALLRKAGIRDDGMLLSLLDLVSMGTLADVVPLRGENRVLAVQGLQSISLRKRLGLRQLSEAAGLSGGITTRAVNFGLAPRINAAGRLEHASLAVDLLMEKDEGRARESARELNRINVRRQEIGSAIQEEVFVKLKSGRTDDHIVLSKGSGWHPGVIGIVASRVVDAFNLPAVLIGVDGGYGRGSARSMDEVDIYGILSTCADLFEDFGGHRNAAGFRIRQEKIDELSGRLKEQAKKKISPEQMSPRTDIDLELSFSDVNMGLVKELERLSPYGAGNPEPVFMTGGLRAKDWRLVGRGNHLKAKFSSGDSALDVIGFDLGEKASMLNYSSLYDIVYTLRVSEWEGFESAELRLIDIRERK